MGAVPRAVAVDLVSPVDLVRLRKACASFAGVSVPEAALDEEDGADRGEDEIGLSRKFLGAGPKLDSESAHDRADY